MSKKLHVNIPFDEAIDEMVKYAKFLKEIISNKKKLKDFTIVSLNKECFAIVLKKLPPKLKTLVPLVTCPLIKHCVT